MKPKEKVLKCLKDFGRLPTSRIAGICGLYFLGAMKLLNEMAEDGKILKEKETMAIYWRLKDEV